MPISKSYIGGTLIGTDTVADVNIYIDAIQGVIVAALRQMTNGYITYASIERLEDIASFITYDTSFLLSDLAYFAHDGDLQELFDEGHIKGAYLADNIQVGNWGAFVKFHDEFDHKTWYHQFHKAENYLDLRPTGNPIFITTEQEFNVVGTDLLIIQDHQVLYILSIYAPTNPGKLPSLLLAEITGNVRPPRIENGVTNYDGWQVDISDVLDTQLLKPLPSLVSDNLFADQNTSSVFRIKQDIANANDLDSESGLYIEESYLWAIKARISEEDFPRWQNYIYSKYIGENGRWITWQPNDLEAPVNMPIYFSFLINRVPKPAFVKIYFQVHFQDTTSTVIEGQKIETPFDCMVINVGMGYNQLNLQNHENLTHGPIMSYTVWLVDNIGYRVSRKRRIYLIPSSEYDRFIVFSNALGGLDSIRLKIKSESVSIVAESVQLGLSDSYNNTDQEYFANNKSGLVSYTFDTPYLSFEWLSYLQDIWHSTDIALLNGSQFEACNLASKVYQLPADKNALEIVEIELTSAKIARGPFRLPLPLAEARPIAWLPKQPYTVDTIPGASVQPSNLNAYALLQKHYVDVLPAKPVSYKDGTPGELLKPNLSGTTGYVSPIILSS